MHYLTKFFVILVAIASVFMVALVVPYVANTEDMNEQVKRLNQENAGAKRLAALNSDEIVNQIRAHQADIDAQRAERRQLEDELSAKRKELDALIARVKSLEADARTKEANISALMAQSRLATEMANVAQTDLKQETSTRITLSTRVIELTAKIDELESQTAEFDRKLRQSQEAMTALEEQNRDLEKQLVRAGVGADEAAQAEADKGFMPTFVIEGKVTKVAALDDKTLVEVNVGQKDAVEPNMIFLIHRNNQYLGRMLMVQVDQDAAVGEVQLIKPGATLAAGDSVYTGNVAN